jgi:hypothetical protein
MVWPFGPVKEVGWPSVDAFRASEALTRGFCQSFRYRFLGQASPVLPR